MDANNSQGSDSRLSASSEDATETEQIVKRISRITLGDEKDWSPQEVLKILQVDCIKVVQLANFDRFDQVKKEFYDSKIVGLTVITKNDYDFDNNQLLLVCLTTKNYIFAIDPHKGPKEVKFLQNVFRSSNFEIYSADGAWDAYHLADTLDIKIGKENHFDLSCIDFELSLMAHVENNPGDKNYLTGSHINKHVRPRPRLFQELVKCWLNIDEKLLDCYQEELGSLEIKPFDTAARNLIKKRAALTRALAVELTKARSRRILRPSRNLYKFCQLSNEQREQADRYGVRDYADICQFTV